MMCTLEDEWQGRVQGGVWWERSHTGTRGRAGMEDTAPGTLKLPQNWAPGGTQAEDV